MRVSTVALVLACCACATLAESGMRPIVNIARTSSSDRKTNEALDREAREQDRRASFETREAANDAGVSAEQRGNVVPASRTDLDPSLPENRNLRAEPVNRGGGGSQQQQQQQDQQQQDQQRQDQQQQRQQRRRQRQVCDPRVDLPLCGVHFRSKGQPDFAFRADGNPMIPVGQEGSCCTLAGRKKECGHCCGFACSDGLVPISPVPTLIDVLPSDELCCMRADPRPVPADVVIAVDYSWSVQRYRKHLAQELRFVEAVTSSLLDPSRNGRYRVGVAAFSGNVHWKHGLTDDASKFAMSPKAEDLVKANGAGAKNAFIRAKRVALNPITGIGYPTFTDLAIDAAAEELASSRARTDAKKILFLLTDGAPWPQVQHTSGRYKGKGDRVVKAIAAAERFKARGYSIIYVSVHSEDIKQYPSFTTTDLASGVPTFSWRDGGDANKILAMCLFSKDYCSPAVHEYGAAYCDSDDGDRRMATEIVKWDKDPFPTAYPSSAEDSRVSSTFETYGKVPMRYVSARPRDGMSRFQYTDLAWRRQQVLWRRLAANSEELAKFESLTISVNGFTALLDRLDMYVERSTSAIDRVARAVPEKAAA